MLVKWFVVFLLMLPLANAEATRRDLDFSQDVQNIPEANLWFNLNPELIDKPLVVIQTSLDYTQFAHQQPGGQSGVFATYLNVPTYRPESWYISLEFPFLDRAVLFWKSNNGDVKKLIDLKDGHSDTSPWLLHSTAFNIRIPNNDAGQIWLVIKTPHSANSKEINVFTQQAFYRMQFVSDALTILTLSVMGLLSLLSLLIYARTHYRLTLLSAGNTGFHMIGWAGACGLLNYFIPANLTFIHFYFFAFGMFCSVLFLRSLFSFPDRYPRLNKVLIVMAGLSLLSGVGAFSLDDKQGYFVSLVVSTLWVVLNICVATFLLFSPDKDYRVKYYFTGSVALFISLLYYLVAKSPPYNTQFVPELGVMVAFTIECICLLLSLTEWLRLKQRDLNTATTEARIDSLTEVGNRLLMNEKLRHLKAPYVIAFIDFDGMKAINDSYGHVEGDRFLVFVAQRLSQELKGIGSVYRAGGDEFVVFAEHECDGNVTPRLVAAFNACEASLQKTWPEAGLSYGIVASSPKYTAEECLRFADEKMYEFKSKKKQGLHATMRPKVSKLRTS